MPVAIEANEVVVAQLVGNVLVTHGHDVSDSAILYKVSSCTVRATSKFCSVKEPSAALTGLHFIATVHGRVDLDDPYRALPTFAMVGDETYVEFRLVDRIELLLPWAAEGATALLLIWAWRQRDRLCHHSSLAVSQWVWC